MRDLEGAAIPAVQASYANFVWGTPPEAEPLYPELGIATHARAQDGLLEVLDVEKDSPAAAAGLKVGDVLVSLRRRTDPEQGNAREGDGRQALGRRGDSGAAPGGREPSRSTILLRRKPRG